VACALALLGPILSASRCAFAQDAMADDVVDVAIAGDDAEVARLVDALREPLQRLGLTPRLSRPSAPPFSRAPDAGTAPRAIVWIDTRAADRVDVEIAAGQATAEHPAERSVPRTAAGPIVVEQVAYEVRATLESLLSAPAPAPTPPPAPAPAPPPVDRAPSTPPLPTRTEGFGADLAVFATARSIASSQPAVLGGGGAVDFAFWGRRTWRPHLWVAGSFDAAFTSTSPEVTLVTNTWTLRVTPSLDVLHAGPLWVDVGAGAGLDFFHVVPSNAAAPSVALAPAATFAEPAIGGQILLGTRLGRAVSAVLAFDLDYDLQPHRFTAVDRFGTTSRVLDPWAARPALLAGLCLPLAGAAACGGSE
jgi:hypothetical protein